MPIFNVFSRFMEPSRLPGIKDLPPTMCWTFSDGGRHGHDRIERAVAAIWPTAWGSGHARRHGEPPDLRVDARRAQNRKDPAGKLVAKNTFGRVKTLATAALRQESDAGDIRLRDRRYEQLPRRSARQPGDDLELGKSPSTSDTTLVSSTTIAAAQSNRGEPRSGATAFVGLEQFVDDRPSPHRRRRLTLAPPPESAATSSSIERPQAARTRRLSASSSSRRGSSTALPWSAPPGNKQPQPYNVIALHQAGTAARHLSDPATSNCPQYRFDRRRVRRATPLIPGGNS